MQRRAPSGHWRTSRSRAARRRHTRHTQRPEVRVDCPESPFGREHPTCYSQGTRSEIGAPSQSPLLHSRIPLSMIRAGSRIPGGWRWNGGQANPAHRRGHRGSRCPARQGHQPRRRRCSRARAPSRVRPDLNRSRVWCPSRKTRRDRVRAASPATARNSVAAYIRCGIAAAQRRIPTTYRSRTVGMNS
jgi:hypothetical protein